MWLDLWICLLVAHLSFSHPPLLKRWPEQEIGYRIGQRVELPCVADAFPAAKYEWYKDGKKLEISGAVKRMPGVGTIVFEEPLSRQEGFYQCHAKNDLGTAVTIKTHLRKATLEPFPVVKDPRVWRPEVGSPQKLECNPPVNYPKGPITWAVAESGSSGGPSKTVEISKRIAQDFQGHLYFANVVAEDSQAGKVYVCVVDNPRLRTTSRGDDQRIEPQSVVETPSYMAPDIIWSSETVTTAIKGEPKRLKCIFTGYPTPNVTWSRIDSQMTSDVEIRDFGRELFIPQADHVHVGKYRCSGSNSRVQAQPVFREFDLFVESPPFWIEEMRPKQVAEEEDVQFKCSAGGAPAPKVEWLVNGKDLSSLGPDSRRVVGTNTLSLTNVTNSDSMVLQCNVSNKHGYIFTNAYLNVLAEPPSFTAPLKAINKVAMRQNVTIKCEVFGAPTPTKTWKKRIEPKKQGGKVRYVNVLNDPRCKQLDNGDLLIMGVMDTDAGMYTCIASNKFGSKNQTGRVVVRNATEITQAPESKNVLAGQDIVFHCSATTDQQEKKNLKYTWLRDGKPIDFSQEGRISYNTDDHSLIINQVAVADNGTFTCVVDNGLDKEEATASLIVRDRPDPPTNVLLTSCMTRAAQITWLPGAENNDEVKEFRVYYNSSHDDPGTFHFKTKTRRGVHSVSITLAPYAKYHFHVVAINSVGRSDRSMFTPSVCETPPQRPDVNPSKVCTRSGQEDQLTITWQPMQPSEQNGPGFYYKIGYKLLSEKDTSDWTTAIVRDETQKEYIVHDTPMFTPYLIYVQAVNQIGPSYSLEEMVGWSGEGVPSVVPQNFGLSDLFQHNGSSAIFVWDRVEDDPATIKGHFKGYQIQFWKVEEPEVKRAHDVFGDEVRYCMSLDEYNRRNPTRFRRQLSKQVYGHVHNLWADSDLAAAVLVMNGKSSGSLSDPPLEFTTPEGVPSEVSYFEVVETGSHHLVVEWDEPDEHNGKLVGYVLQYKGENDDQGTELTFDDPAKRRHKLRPLTNDTTYSIVLRARTATGSGPPRILEKKTLSVMSPDTPQITGIQTGEDYINVTWTPSDGETRNPGAEFCLEYRKKGEDEWTRTQCEHDKNWINVTGLTYGDEYEVVVVAKNGVGDEEKSKPTTVIVGKNEEPVLANIANAWWFIILMIIIALLLLILIIVCLVRRNRGGKYPVHEKEKLRGKDQEKDDLDTPYGEYTRTDTPEKKSQLSFDELPPPESDIDSMAEYYETDPSKFNEDGSFIGQYGGKGGKRDSRLGPENEVASPNALSTFV